MTTYNTGNPIGSTAAKDLYDNAENLDVLVNDRTVRSHADRLGVERKTWWGMEEDFQDFLINSGYQNIGDYGAGLEITARNQIFWRDGEIYRAGASLELPYTTTGDWGSEEPLFVAIGDAAISMAIDEALKGRNIFVVDSIPDLLVSGLHERDDREEIVVFVRRYWPGFVSSTGSGFFWWNPSGNLHDGGISIRPTVPWDGSTATHEDFLDGVGDTAPGAVGRWQRIQSTESQSPLDFGAGPAPVVPDNYYIFQKFEERRPGYIADLGGMIMNTSVAPSGAKYVNGIFRLINDSNRQIDSGWSSAVRVGNRNALVGRNTATNLTTNGYEQSGGKGYNLTALGDGALHSAGNNVKHNTAIGPNALYNNQYARYNVAMGLEALYSLTGSASNEDIGSRNVALGDNTARFNQGAHNIAIGRNAMQCKVDGDYNIHIGSAAAGGIGPVGLDGETIQNPFPTSGGYKVGVGMLSLNWAFADNATAFGAQALENLKGGVNNCALGSRAMFRLESEIAPTGGAIRTTGAGAVTWTKSGNTLTVSPLGVEKYANNFVAIRFTSGVPSNVTNVVQYLKVDSVDSGSWTVALTAEEAAAIDASGNATEIEVYAHSAEPTNDNNVAVGNNAAQALLTGQENVFVGQAAGYNFTNATQCTAVGRSALRFTTSGGSLTSETNCTGVGYNARVSGANQVQLGDSATTTYVYGTVQNRSDIRDKADVQDTPLGIDFVMGLRPVQGRWDMRDDYHVVDNQTGEVTHLPKDGSKKRTRLHQWLIAQEVVSLCDQMGVEFGGIQHHAVNGGEDVYSLGYDEFIPPIIKALQECWGRMDLIVSRLEALENK